MIIGFKDYAPQTQRLAQALGCDFALAEVHYFPDGESRVTVPSDLPGQVIICRSLDNPNQKLVELLLAAGSCRKLGAHHITLVAPYLCYMRQDTAFHPGEAVSQRIIGRFLGQLFDALVTVDPHLHRTTSLNEVIPDTETRALSSAEPMGRFLAEHEANPMLVGPDSESAQWVHALAQRGKLDYAVAEKERLGDQEVHIQLPAGDYNGREVVLVDDIASSGGTLIEVTRQLKLQGAAAIHCLITHALFSQQTSQRLHAAGIDQIWSSDSITHPTNTVHLAEHLAEAVRTLT